MSSENPTTSSQERNKSAQIDNVLTEMMRRRQGGDMIDSAGVARAHPELMPELGERLRALEAIEGARRRAQRSFLSSQAEAPREPWLEEDLEFLRRSLEHYEVLERLRYGGQGIVYKARQKGANRMVAIKVLLDGPLASDRQRYRFEREIELISRLHHPNVVTLYETGTVRGRHYFAMEFIDGLPIDDYVLLHDLTPREVVRLFIKVCRAVSYAHQNGVIHRDLSPANILVDDQGEPHVFDFGLAKDVWSSNELPAYSFTGQVIGTLQYLSPEQAGGLDGKVDIRSDIYTLGVVLYELLTDGFPYPIQGEPREIRNAILNAGPEPLRRAAARGERDRIRDPDSINRDLETILAKALAKEKDERYQSVAGFADDLERCLAGDAVTARVDNPLYLLRKTLRRYRLPVTVAAVVLVTLGASAVAVTALWFQARSERDNAREAARVAYDLFDTAVTDLDTAVRPLAGGVAVRDRMIARLADRMPRLETLIESDAALDAIATRLAEKQGDLAYEQGDTAAAIGHYEAFLSGSRRLAALEPEDTTYADGLVRAYRKYAPVTDAPEDVYEEGLRVAKDILQTNPARAAARLQLCQLHVALGTRLFHAEAYDEALAHFDEVVGLCNAVDESKATGIDWLRIRAETANRRGAMLLRSGQGEAGIAELMDSLRLREQIAEAYPADTQSRYDLMLAYTYAARARRDAGDVDEAEQLLKQAIECGELLRLLDPTVAEWGIDLYAAYDVLVQLCLDLQKWEDAATLSERALRLADEFANHGPEGMRMLGFARVLQGQLHFETGAAEDAHATFLEAVAIRESLLKDDPENFGYKDDLAVVHGWLGRTNRRLGASQAAASHYQKAYEIRQKLRESQPDVMKRSLDVVKSQINLAVAFMDREQPEFDREAARLLENAEQLLESSRQAGGLFGFERVYKAYITAIHNNQRILHERACVEDEVEH